MSYEYDDLEDFYGIDADDRTKDYWSGDDDLENDSDDSFDDSMDGDAESALASAGWGTDEDYGYYGHDGIVDLHADESVGFVHYNEDGPYDD